MSDPLKSPKLFVRFWLDAFKEAFWWAWGTSGVMSLLIPDLIIVAGKIERLAHLAFIKWVCENPNLARLYCVGIVILLYLIYAPYRKYKETQIHAFKQMKGAFDRLATVVEERDKLRAQLQERRRRKEFANKLASVMDKGRELASRCADTDASAHPNEEEIGLWTDSAYVELSLNGLGMSGIYVARYNAAQDMSGMAIVGIHLDRSRDYKWLMSKVNVLGEFIKELMQPS